MCEQVDEKRTECSLFIKSPGLSNIHSVYKCKLIRYPNKSQLSDS